MGGGGGGGGGGGIIAIGGGGGVLPPQAATANAMNITEARPFELIRNTRTPTQIQKNGKDYAL